MHARRVFSVSTTNGQDGQVTKIVSENANNILRLPVAQLEAVVAAIFGVLGLQSDAARFVASCLVEADLEGIPSHGVMLTPMYVKRIQSRSVSLATQARVVSDRGSALVLDADNTLGQLTSRQAVALLTDRAPKHGLAAVAVRNGFHFGTAGRWALDLAAHGLIGIVMSNTRPLMPAPGGAQRVVGNNPMAIAMPTAEGPPVVLDMAMSATAMGKIRLAEAAGQSIPSGWATDAAGQPTTDPAEAIKGMLLPAAGHKGFGLALLIDLFCGGLSSGAIADTVRPLYGDPTLPYGCAHFFLALDVARFRDIGAFAREVSRLAQHVRASAKASGVDRIFTPGEPAWESKQRNAGQCPLAAETAHALEELAKGLGIGSAALNSAD